MITVTRSDLPPLEEYADILQGIWERRWLTNHGSCVQELEQKLAAYLRVPTVQVLNNGTLAIHIALRGLRVKGEVITTPFTFAATTNVLVWEGMKPVFADVDPETFNIDPADIRRKITPKTTAILGVHVYGNPCAVEEIQAIADEHGLKVIYDAAHAFGVDHKGASILTHGDASTLSFHATKVFHTIEGGAVVTPHAALQEEVALMRNSGIRSETEVVLPGTNAKMNEFQAAMGLCNLPRLGERLEARRVIYERYTKGLAGLDVQFQRLVTPTYNYSYMPVVFPTGATREAVYHALMADGVKARRYFYPLTVQASYFPPGATAAARVPVAESLTERVLCLPIYPDLAHADVDRIISIVRTTAG